MPQIRWPQKPLRGPSPLPRGVVPADLQARRRERGLGRTFIPGLGESGFEELSYGPMSIPYNALPIDLHPRLIQEYTRNPDGSISAGAAPASALELYLQRIADSADMIASTIVLHRGLLGRTVEITPVPQLIINAEFLRGYILLNPNETAGATAAGTLLPSALRTAISNGFSAPLGTANFMGAHFYLDVSAINAPAQVTITLQSLDPSSGQWADSQVIFNAVTATGTYYAFVDAVGVATDVRVAWSVTVGGDATFSVGFVLKGGVIGTGSGTLQTIFLGGNEVSVEAGFPLLNGQNQKFFLRENVQLWAVSNSVLPLKIFEL